MIQGVYHPGMAAADTNGQSPFRPNPQGQVVFDRIRAFSAKAEP